MIIELTDTVIDVIGKSLVRGYLMTMACLAIVIIIYIIGTSCKELLEKLEEKEKNKYDE